MKQQEEEEEEGDNVDETRRWRWRRRQRMKNNNRKKEDEGDDDDEDNNCNILCILELSFPSTTLSILPQPDIIASKMNDDNFQHHFEYKVFERSKHRLVCVAHTITSNASFNEIKNAIQIPLRQNKCFIRINNWGTELNIVNVGWIYKANPKIHNRNQIKTIIKSACDRLNIKFVDFELFTKGLSFHQPNS